MIFSIPANSATLLLWESMCLSLLWVVFCRSVYITKAVRLDIRLSVFAVGLAALFGIGAPVYGWTPDLVTMLITSSLAVLHLVLSHASHMRATDVTARRGRRLEDKQNDQQPKLG